MYQPRLNDLNREQVLRFNEIKRSLKRGIVPAGLLSPTLINAHNENSPAVAKIDHAGQEVSLDSLIVHYLSNGVEARSVFKRTVSRPTVSNGEDFDLPVRHDSSSAKLHKTLDELED